ncbi:hypothetical protein Leucomu_09730 [Leucobacter muris]|uniref:Uncharacterized protein n=1 Tax=Leucobacter muris TaxID=1935379 RepID=A0ABX5QGL3_9MICO|nr:hypothetical protein [Leucobacter muris]QAB18161.1 hypothetical protein Leucomu_09730 [Leucobacter muris]
MAIRVPCSRCAVSLATQQTRPVSQGRENTRLTVPSITSSPLRARRISPSAGDTVPRWRRSLLTCTRASGSPASSATCAVNSSGVVPVGTANGIQREPPLASSARSLRDVGSAWPETVAEASDSTASSSCAGSEGSAGVVESAGFSG